MARAKKDKADEATTPDGQTFEEILAQLEGLVARLERGEQPLEVALADFEAGMALSRKANEVLEKAEVRLARLSAGEGHDEEPLALGGNQA